MLRRGHEEDHGSDGQHLFPAGGDAHDRGRKFRRTTSDDASTRRAVPEKRQENGVSKATADARASGAHDRVERIFGGSRWLRPR